MWIVGVVVLVLLVLFVLLARYVGGKFLKNLERLDPGEHFKADIDISFYEKGLHKAAAARGLALMDTLPHEDIYITARDGEKLHATLFSAEKPGRRYVLGIHGYQSKAWTEYAPFIAFYRSLGFSMLLPDDRGHGYSGGPYITLGVKDRLDCVDWAKYLVEREGDQVEILLHGVSMGAASVLGASGEPDLPAQVFGAVSDCGYTCVTDMLLLQMKLLYHVPAMPLTMGICRWYGRKYVGIDITEGRPVDQVKKARIPILFVQGAEDVLVPKEMVSKLYEACASRKELLMVEGAAHAESIAAAPELYQQTVCRFFSL